MSRLSFFSRMVHPIFRHWIVPEPSESALRSAHALAKTPLRFQKSARPRLAHGNSGLLLHLLYPRHPEISLAMGSLGIRRLFKNPGLSRRILWGGCRLFSEKRLCSPHRIGDERSEPCGGRQSDFFPQAARLDAKTCADVIVRSAFRLFASTLHISEVLCGN